MKNKKGILLVVVLIFGALLIAGLMALFSHFGFLGKPFVFLSAVAFVLFVLAVFFVAAKMKK